MLTSMLKIGIRNRTSTRVRDLLGARLTARNVVGQLRCRHTARLKGMSHCGSSRIWYHSVHLSSPAIPG
jgi:hypothetical protein